MFFIKLKIDLLYDPATPLLDIYLEECECACSSNTCTPMLIVALFTVAKLRNQPTCLIIDERIKKL
jgi:hypothetical protein